MLQSHSATCTGMEVADHRKVAHVAMARIFTDAGQLCMVINVHT
jgi:acyl-CoA reductase-like NAD-dependent aldehyde dehydrogenase